ncbi:2-keto-4-pentenoate hydratase [Cupriavidus sp. H39]|uniref:2-keto-4-pentenoate hydratase n=1 Tax=Cupriavidus sp. H39 TaxID=3401635 RepID=UPI003D057E6C
MSVDILQLAQRLDEAALHAQAIEQLTASARFSLPQAYAIQRASIARRDARGELPLGIKLGFTSRAKMAQMGVDALIWGLLTDGMLEEEGGTVDLARYIHPRVEPEICFLLKETIDGPLTQLELAQYVEAVAPAAEIIDSRYRNFRFTLEDVVADNCSSAGLVVGAWARPDIDLANLGVALCFDGRARQLGSTAAILGNPWRALVQASRLAAAAEMPLRAGSLVLAGAATAAEALVPGCHVSVEIHGLGCAAFHTRRSS